MTGATETEPGESKDNLDPQRGYEVCYVVEVEVVVDVEVVGPVARS